MIRHSLFHFYLKIIDRTILTDSTVYEQSELILQPLVDYMNDLSDYVMNELNDVHLCEQYKLYVDQLEIIIDTYGYMLYPHEQ